MSVPLHAPIQEDFIPQGSVDFAWLTRAWAFFTAQPGVWVSTFLLYFLISVGLWLVWAIPTGTLAALQQAYLTALGHAVPIVRPPSALQEYLQESALTLILTGVNLIFLGGLYRMALQQSRGQRLYAVGLFSAFPRAPALLLLGIVMSVPILIVQGVFQWLLHRAGLVAATASSLSSMLAFVPTTIIEGLLMFAPILILDRNLNASQAIIGSVRLLRGQAIKGVWFYFVASLVGGLGALLCGIGMLATYPVFLISIALGYVALMEPPPALVSPYNTPQESVWPPPPRLDNNLPPV